MNRPLVVLHGIHLNDYDGSLEGFYAGGFKWAAENGWGGEVLNFRSTSGRCEVVPPSWTVWRLS